MTLSPSLFYYYSAHDVEVSLSIDSCVLSCKVQQSRWRSREVADQNDPAPLPPSSSALCGHGDGGAGADMPNDERNSGSEEDGKRCLGSSRDYNGGGRIQGGMKRQKSRGGDRRGRTKGLFATFAGQCIA
jgi:hypothetical protein